MAINLKSFVDLGLDSIFDQLGQLVEEVKLVGVIGGGVAGRGVYDPSTGTFTGGNPVDAKTVKVDALRLDLDLHDGEMAPSKVISGGNVEIATSQFLIQAKNLTGITVSNYSEIEEFEKDGAGQLSTTVKTIWRIIQIKLDPTESFYEIFVREAS